MAASEKGPTVEHLMVLVEKMIQEQLRLLRAVRRDQRELHQRIEDLED